MTGAPVNSNEPMRMEQLLAIFSNLDMIIPQLYYRGLVSFNLSVLTNITEKFEKKYLTYNNGNSLIYLCRKISDIHNYYTCL